MVTTESGMVTEVRAVSRNASFSINVTELPIVTVVRAVFSVNAY